MANFSPNLSRIVEGHQCHIEEYPYMVLLVLRQIYKPLCGGTILTPIWILTAGHCLFTYPQNYVVFSGLLSLEEMYTARKVPLLAYYRHPEYRTTVANDICLLRLQLQLFDDGKIQFVSLSFENFTRNFVRSCANSIVMGYGMQTKTKPDKTPVGPIRNNKRLNCAYMSVLEDRFCDRLVQRSRSEFCAIDTSQRGQDCCFGDSGGPIICNEKQIGIISKGYGCAMGVPVKFTRIHMFKDFIESTMANGSLENMKITGVVALCFILLIYLL